MEDIKTYYKGLSRDLDNFISGIEDVERIFGAEYDFHDAEIDDIHIDAVNNKISLRLWDCVRHRNKEYYHITWEIEGCVAFTLINFDPNADRWVSGFEAEHTSYHPERIRIIFDGTSVEADCKHVALTIERTDE